MFRGLRRVFACLAVVATAAVSMQSARADYIFGGGGGEPMSLTIVHTAGVTILTTGDAPALGAGLNQGWWSGTLDNVDDNDNYFAGENPGGGELVNDFFTFNPTALRGETVISASFEPFAYTISAAVGVIYTMYDVSTDPVALNTNVGTSAAIFADLGGGVSYGSYFIPTAVSFTTLELPLNAAGLADLQAAIDSGSLFSIGGTASAFVVPEPGSLTLVGLGALGLVAGAIRRRRGPSSMKR